MSERFNLDRLRTRAGAALAAVALTTVVSGGLAESAHADTDSSATATASATATETATATDTPGSGETTPSSPNTSSAVPTASATATTATPKPSSTSTPTPKPKPLPKLCTIQIMGHRGSDNGRNVGQTEDTLNQFKAFNTHIAKRPVALKLAHMPGLETDVWKAATDSWWNNHDYTLDRTTRNGHGPVPHHRGAYIGSRRENDGHHPTTVAAANDFVGRTKMPMEEEIKPSTISRKQGRRLMDRVVGNHLQNRFTFTSFHAQPLRVIGSINRARHLRVKRVYLSTVWRNPNDVNNFATGLSLDADSSTKAHATAIHRAGMLAATWTINSVGYARGKAADGYDEVITEYPNHMLDFCAPYVNK